MKLQARLFRTAALAALLSMTALGAQAADMQTFTPLPEPNCGTPTVFVATNNCIQYGDFASFSLAHLFAIETFNTTGTWPTGNPNPGDPYYVTSTPGELGIDGYIVYGTGTNNNNVVTNAAGTLIDNAQEQPSGVTSSFAVSAATETTPTFTGDNLSQWTATLSAMRTELGLGSDPTGQFVIYFNLNETGDEGLEGIDILAWGAVTLRDTDGGLPDRTFFLTNDPGDTTAPLLTDPADDDWVYVHGTICSSPSGFLGFGPCTDAQKAIGGRDVNQNLGANTAAYALYNAELSALVLDSGYDFLDAQWRYLFINNGYEQLFSALTPFQVPPEQVPEPASLGLLALGLLLLGARLRRQRRGAGA